jgi:hypothetical protein
MLGLAKRADGGGTLARPHGDLNALVIGSESGSVVRGGAVFGSGYFEAHYPVFSMSMPLPRELCGIVRRFLPFFVGCHSGSRLPRVLVR